jgi:Xaa-Pro dipeptidase
MRITRRTFIKSAGLTIGSAALMGNAACDSSVNEEPPAAIQKLKSVTEGIVPISLDERLGRIEKARMLMDENSIDVIFLEPGSSMTYFCDISWWRSERMLGLFIFANGEIVYICPKFEENKLHERMKIDGKVYTWEEHEDPYKLVAQLFREKRIQTANLGLEETVRFFIAHKLSQAIPGIKILSADPVTVGCRIIKSSSELALMKKANEITIEAYRAGISELKEGMTQHEFSGNVSAAFSALGVKGGVFAQFGEYTAFPHGSSKLQKLKQGDVVLMDGGCSVEGYRSDISRTIIFGKPNKKQTEVWNIIHQAQDVVLKTARPGATCESLDLAARQLITENGFGPDYKYFSHRLGHGIGLDGHEWTYLVKGNKTKLAPGMCFSNEPGIYIYGEFGMRLEDCMYITDDGVELFSKQSPSIDEPFA